MRTISLNGEFRFIEATNASEAIKRLARTRPDLIFLDINLGDENGFDLLSSLKKMEATADIPIVICSANIAANYIETAQSLGAAGFIPKPISAKQVRSVVQKILDPDADGDD